MKTARFLFIWIAVGLIFGSVPSSAADRPLSLSLAPDSGNPSRPIMGDRLRFWSTISNPGQKPLKGLVAWISLVEIDPGNEQPVDLEDWSAHKAITGAELGPGQSLKTDWPMRLIKSGDYRVVVSVMDRGSRRVFTSPMIAFHVRKKAALSSARIVFVAAGVPFLLMGWIGILYFRRRRRYHEVD